ncbi:hypothetical protein GQX73_g8295 [Xylaria multiplex]|uniref:Rhodopsin domain-containing protein n=1 Tax=Xylaria multiplex TaxID=323545 RepID=A0A7C8IJL5_9PEZI|nr:hypothetical protein GQX73_g8295 [Xylaria multiplex]
MSALPTKDEINYMLAHASDTLVPNIIVCTSVCGIATIVFIGLRLYSQSLVRHDFYLNLSDWFLIIAWVFFAAFDIAFALTTRAGGGRHILFATDPRLLQILNIADENTYCYAMAFIKLSILSLYGNIFSSKRFHYVLWTVAAIVCTWAISIATVAIFQCTPIAFGWDPTIPGGFCINYGLVVLVAGVINIITDFTILGMPIPLIWRLNISKQKKRELTITFALGGSACVVSIIRLAFALRVGTTSDGSWDNIPAGLLSVVELMTGILAASIPTYRPLYQRLFYGPAVASQQPTGKGSMSGKGSEATVNDQTFVRNSSRNVSVSAGRFPPEFRPGISVTDQIEMVVYSNKGGNWKRVSDTE